MQSLSTYYHDPQLQKGSNTNHPIDRNECRIMLSTSSMFMSCDFQLCYWYDSRAMHFEARSFRHGSFRHGSLWPIFEWGRFGIDRRVISSTLACVCVCVCVCVGGGL